MSYNHILLNDTNFLILHNTLKNNKKMTKDNQKQMLARMESLLKNAKESVEKEHNGSLFFDLEEITTISVTLAKIAYQKVMEEKKHGSDH